jgi:hypothetical protein
MAQQQSMVVRGIQGCKAAAELTAFNFEDWISNADKGCCWSERISINGSA